MRYEWHEYGFADAITLALPAADVMRWLVTPDLMRKWIAGLHTILLYDARPDVVGARTRLKFASSKGSPVVFFGDLVELTEHLLARSYRPVDARGKYERAVRHDLQASGATTILRSSVRITLYAPSAALRHLPVRQEAFQLRRSLERLQLAAEGRQHRLPVLRWLRDSSLLPGPLYCTSASGPERK